MIRLCMAGIVSYSKWLDIRGFPVKNAAMDGSDNGCSTDVYCIVYPSLAAMDMKKQTMMETSKKNIDFKENDGGSSKLRHTPFFIRIQSIRIPRLNIL